MVSLPTSTNSTQSATDTYAQLHEYSGHIRALTTARKTQYRRGDAVTAVICLTCAIATVEPATNQWLKSTPVGQFFGSIKIEQIVPKALKPEAKPQAQIKWTNPHPGARITSRYDLNREHPVTGKVSEHKGIDLSIALGAPIVAAGDGTVVFTVTECVKGTSDSARYCGGGYGNLVEIDHHNGYSTLYAHLQDVSVQQGQQVKAGQQIGTEGTTGMSTGGHLHFEMREGLKALNPEKVFPANTWEYWK